MAKPKIKFVLIKMHVRIGDIVMVISGLDKGKTGKITKVFTKKGKVLVEGINVVIKYLKPSQINP
jgi:large subunit ribosomal protein L24